jgi:hypothetical protein
MSWNVGDARGATPSRVREKVSPIHNKLRIISGVEEPDFHPDAVAGLK